MALTQGRRPYLPGPAGRLQALRDAGQQITPASLGLVDPAGGAATVGLGVVQGGPAAYPPSGSDDPDFSSAAWLAALESFDAASYEEARTLLPHSLRTAAGQPFRKVPRLLALVASLTASPGGDAFAQLKDPEGQMGAALHQDVLQAVGSQLAPRAVLLLQQVCVVSPRPGLCYLCVTADNVMQVFPPAAPAFLRPAAGRQPANGGPRPGGELHGPSEGGEGDVRPVLPPPDSTWAAPPASGGGGGQGTNTMGPPPHRQPLRQMHAPQLRQGGPAAAAVLPAAGAAGKPAVSSGSNAPSMSTGLSSGGRRRRMIDLDDMDQDISLDLDFDFDEESSLGIGAAVTSRGGVAGVPPQGPAVASGPMQNRVPARPAFVPVHDLGRGGSSAMLDGGGVGSAGRPALGAVQGQQELGGGRQGASGWRGIVGMSADDDMDMLDAGLEGRREGLAAGRQGRQGVGVAHGAVAQEEEQEVEAEADVPLISVLGKRRAAASGAAGGRPRQAPEDTASTKQPQLQAQQQPAGAQPTAAAVVRRPGGVFMPLRSQVTGGAAAGPQGAGGGAVHVNGGMRAPASAMPSGEEPRSQQQAAPGVRQTGGGVGGGNGIGLKPPPATGARAGVQLRPIKSALDLFYCATQSQLQDESVRPSQEHQVAAVGPPAPPPPQQPPLMPRSRSAAPALPAGPSFALLGGSRATSALPQPQLSSGWGAAAAAAAPRPSGSRGPEPPDERPMGQSGSGGAAPLSRFFLSVADGTEELQLDDDWG